MDIHSINREHFAAEADKQLRNEQHDQTVQQMVSLERTVALTTKALIQYMQGATTKTQLINQLDTMKTPDVANVVKAVEGLKKDVQNNKIDLSPIEKQLSAAVKELALIPKKLPEAPETMKSIKVSNLSEIDFSSLEQALKSIKFVNEAPIVNVDAPKVNVDAPDLKPLQKSLDKLIKAVEDSKPKIEIPETDLTKVEKELAKHTKQFDELLKKPFGGGGGGGNGTPYTDSDGKPVYIIRNADGSIPVTVVAGGGGGGSSATVWYLSNIDDATSTEYYGYEDKDGNWYVKKLASNSIKFATGATDYATNWTNRTSLTYASAKDTF